MIEMDKNIATVGMRNKLNICKDYIRQICYIKKMTVNGVPAIFGLEKDRINLHEILCNLFDISHLKSKEVLSYLDVKIGLDINSVLNDMNNEEYLETYAQKLYDYLQEHLNELKN